MRARAPGVERRGRVIALSCVALVFGMVGLSFAAVPLYDLFCKVTGFGGTTQAASVAPDRVVDRRVRVQFDSNVAGLPWRFRPQRPDVELKLGETVVVNYVAENRSDRSTTGTATFNVTPTLVGGYFNKIECFCFTEQTLEPGERVEMPVQFFIDPALAEDHDLDFVSTITLSYTMFPVERPAVTPIAKAGGDTEPDRL